MLRFKFNMALVPAVVLAVAAGRQGAALAAQVTVTRHVPAFKAIELSGAMDLVVAPHGSGDVRLTGDKDALAQVSTQVKEGTLYVSEQAHHRNFSLWHLFDLFHHHQRIRCEVTATRLTSITSSGACNLDVRHLTGEAFSLEASGASNATLGGRIKHLSVEVSGVSNVDARHLAAEQAVLDLSGASHVRVDATRLLKVEASGASDVSYLGKPKVVKDLSGACRVQAE